MIYRVSRLPSFPTPVIYPVSSQRITKNRLVLFVSTPSRGAAFRSLVVCDKHDLKYLSCRRHSIQGLFAACSGA